MNKEELEKYIGELSPEMLEKASACKNMKWKQLRERSDWVCPDCDL